MKNTKIQWSDSTTNPVAGCGGCELWPKVPKLLNALTQAASEAGVEVAEGSLEQVTEDWTAMDFVRRKKALANLVSGGATPTNMTSVFEGVIDEQCKCYAGTLHARYSGHSPGYAQNFNRPEFFAGRMLEASRWSDLRGRIRPDEPWLNGFPRLIFVSDMGDALVKAMPFPLLQKEIIEVVASEKGRRHVWLWLTKRPARMAEFSDWLHGRFVHWPDNLVAMTSVTSRRTVGRVDDLRRVRCRLRGLSVEPLWESVDLPLEEISWTIVGGESSSAARPFDPAWAREIREQCREAEVAFFVKQLGSNPVEDGEPLKLKDGHGGDWDEWPEDLRVRQMPSQFLRVARELRDTGLVEGGAR